jgi:hypothetical protein
VETKGGKRLWVIGGPNTQDKKTPPNPYLSGIFTADGKSVVALTQSEVHVVGMNREGKGKQITRTGGVSGQFAPLRAGAKLLLSNGNSAFLFTPTQGKITKRIDLPRSGVATLALADQDLIAGGEIDGTVTRLKTTTSNPKEQTVWEHKIPGRILKHVAVHDGLTAVVYWGGLVRVYDEKGSVKAARTCSQDVAALAWSGENLVIGLADGRVQSLKAK